MIKMADEDSHYKLLEPDIKRKVSGKKFGCHFAAIAVIFSVAGLFSVGLVFIMFQMPSSSESSVQVASGALKSSWPDPPPHEQVARVARYIVHISDWASIATVSAAPKTAGFPFANILSLSDGPVEQSSGIPYMYLTPMDLTSHDLAKDSRASLSMTEAQSDYCRKNNFDPESPLCARILITGRIVKVEKGSAEEAYAKNAVFSRHPEMKDWPQGHQWFFAKMNITHIYVLDFFGGASDISVEEYFKADPF